jgi:hypothetical protein
MNDKNINLVRTLILDDIESIDEKIKELEKEIDNFEDLERYSSHLVACKYSLEHWYNLRESSNKCLKWFNDLNLGGEND